MEVVFILWGVFGLVLWLCIAYFCWCRVVVVVCGVGGGIVCCGGCSGRSRDSCMCS